MPHNVASDQHHSVTIKTKSIILVSVSDPHLALTYMTWSSDFALYMYLWPCLIDKEGIILWILVQSDIPVNDLILFVGHCDLHFMVQ